MNYCDLVEVGTPVVARSFVSGTFVGRLQRGKGGNVALTDWRWLRSWSVPGKKGSIYDLVHSDVRVDDRSEFTPSLKLLHQTDVMVISEATYTRLAL